MFPKTYEYLIIVITLLSALANSELHSICKFANGKEGSCQLFKNCNSAKNQLIFGVLPQMCDIELVCCENEQDIERDVESSEVDAPLSHLSSGMLISQNCYSGQKANSLSEDTNKLLYSTTTDVKTDSKNLKNENNFLVKIGIRKANGDLHFYCGGVLIRPEFVLTAAHCIDYRGKAPEVVQIGSSKANASEDHTEKIPISKIHQFPDYSKLTMYNDIALLELAVLSSFIPVCMGTLNVKEIGKVASFALGHDLQNGNDMQSTSVEIMSNEYCNEVYTSMRKLPHGVMESQFCIGNANITEAAMCRYYVGGPLLAKEPNGEFYLIGLANYVHMCYTTIYPMIYTKVAAYKQWLESIFNQNVIDPK